MHGRRKPNAIVDLKSKQIIEQIPPPPFHILTLEGGGVACAAFAALFKVMQKYNVADFEHVAGVSGGSIAALCYALGYTAEDMEDILSNIPMDKFMEGSESWKYTPALFSNARKLISIWNSNYHALSSGKVYLAWIQQLVKAKMGNENATFGDLARMIEEEKRVNGFTNKKKLYIGATLVTIGIPELKILGADTASDMPLAIACAASGAYPSLFAPVEYDGHLWTDGGVKNVIVTKHFDDRDFLPPGYDFNDKGVNPGLVAVKVDTDEEIDQMIWGKYKKVKIGSTRDFAGQLLKGASYNEDFSEMRFARNVIPIADGNMDRTDLYQPVDAIQRLVANAEVTTKEFFEHHINAVYKLKSHAGTKEWLASLLLEDVIEIKDIYKDMLAELRQHPEEASARAALTEFDPSKPTIKQLENQIEFLKSYIKSREKLRNFDANKINYPDYHINIPLEMPKNSWREALQKEMQDRLDVLKEKIASAEKYYADLMQELADCMQAKLELQVNLVKERFQGHNDEKVQILISYYEHLNKLRMERDAIESKLGIKCDHHVKPDPANSAEHVVLRDKLTDLQAQDLSPMLRIVMPASMPVFRFSIKNMYDITFTMDIRNADDRKIYLLAAMLYLDRRKCIDKNKFTDAYNVMFPGKELPGSAEDLMRLIGQEDPLLQISLFKLESLLHYFELREQPSLKPVMDLDVMFGLTKISLSSNKKRGDDGEVEMRMIMKSANINDVHHTDIPNVLPAEIDEYDSSPENSFAKAAL